MILLSVNRRVTNLVAIYLMLRPDVCIARIHPTHCKLLGLIGTKHMICEKRRLVESQPEGSEILFKAFVVFKDCISTTCDMA